MKPWSTLFFIYVTATLLAESKNQVLGGFRGSYSPPSCSTNGCPSVSWTFSSLNQTANFTMTSSPNRMQTDNYFSFALASGTEMEDALFVIDCYEPTGTIRLGTSRNVAVNGSLDNVDDPSFQSNLTNTYAAKTSGTLMCAFTLGFNASAWAASSAYIFMAEGYMNSTANASNTAPPKKLYHFQRFASSQSLQAMTSMLNTLSPTGVPSAASGRGQMSSYAVAYLILIALHGLVRQ